MLAAGSTAVFAPGGAAQDAPQAPAGQGDAKAPAFVRGFLSSRYWLRWTGNASDNDLYETLSLDFGDPKKDAVTGHLLGRVHADLDGETNGGATFFGLDDSVGKDVDARLYDGYADLHRVPGLEFVRAGRQRIHDTPELAYFDGVRAETRSLGAFDLRFGGYGGSGAHLYESSAAGDWTVGLFGEARPWDGGRVRFDWMHLEDEALLGPHDDDLLAAGVWQSCGRLQLEGQYTWLEQRDRDLRARAAWTDPERDLLVQTSFRQLLSTQQNLVLELDPLFRALHELDPYWQFGGLIGKGLAECVDVQVGADVRRVEDRADLGTFNRDYDRQYATLHVSDLVVKGLSASVTGDLWHSDTQQVATWGADLGWAATDATQASVGSYYSLYKFDLYANSERDHVRTWYCKLQYKASKAWTLDCSYEFERTDLDDFHVLRMGALWRF